MNGEMINTIYTMITKGKDTSKKLKVVKNEEKELKSKNKKL